MKKVEMRVLDKEMRINNFLEVALGYNDEEALKEASRCLQCQNPRCVSGCPVNIQIPNFIKAIKEGDNKKAYEIIAESSTLPAVCGRVCPQENQCEKMCIKGFKGDAISIGSLERYVADYAIKNSISTLKPLEKKDKKIAIIGSGPSGLSCAGELGKNGFDVTIYEALHKAGGVLTYGIPEFRLPNKTIEYEIDSLKELGVKFVLDTVIGKTITLDELKECYDAIYIASGAGLPKFMGIENEDANEVFSANELLTRINLMQSYKDDASTPIKIGKKIVVVGGGNVACDVARSLRRFNSSVHLMYRRSINELPARKEEVKHLLEEGIVIDELVNPVKIIVDDNNSVIGMDVVNMELTDADETGRRGVKALDDTVHRVDCDMVVMALGTLPNPLATKNSNIGKDEKGLIIVEGTKTSIENIYAGGDAVTGAATVILACEAGKKAAKEIIESFKTL